MNETLEASRRRRVLGWIGSWGPLGASLVAGFASAFVFAGIGTRLAMRVTGIMAGPENVGRITDAGNVVGKITADGTMFLVFFGTIVAGAAGGLVHAAVRPWLPRDRTAPAFGAFALAVGGSVVIEAGNIDFAAFGSPIVNVAMYAGLFVAGGATLQWIYARTRSTARRGAVVLGLLALVVTLQTTIGVFGVGTDGELAVPDARVLFVVIVPLALVTQVVAARRARVSVNDPEAWMGQRLRLVGQLVAAAGVLAGTFMLAREVLLILGD